MNIGLGSHNKNPKKRNTATLKEGACVQVWRYYLLANRPESADTDFKWSDLAAKNNGELLANLGNFINRGLSFVYAKYGPSANLP